MSWQDAKAVRETNRMNASNIRLRVLAHGPEENIEFEFCKGYTCFGVILDTRYTWCEDCRRKFSNR